MRRFLLGASFALLVGAYAWVLGRVRSMEAAEADEWGHRQPLADLEVIAHHQLLAVGVREGQSVVLEVCSDEGFASDAWGSVVFEVWYLPDDERVIARPAGELRAAVRRDGGGARCAVVTHRDHFGVAGELALGASWDSLPEALREVEVQGHGVVWSPVDGAARAALGLILLAACGLVLGLAWPAPRDPLREALEEPEEPGPEPPAWRVLGLGLGALGLALGGLAFVRGGAPTAMVRALLLATVELAAAWLFLRTRASSRSEMLGFVRPRGGWWLLALAPLIGALLRVAGGLLARLLPSTSAAPIEVFVAAPSGALAVGAVALFVPVAEEAFFRGFVYGEVERACGANLATLASVLAFAFAHLPQQWGAWGAFLSLTFTGLVLTLLRRAARSTVWPAFVHLAHNAWITFLSV